jgi:hypothetical protein
MESGKSGKKRKTKNQPSVGFQFKARVTGKSMTFINGNVDNLNIHQGLSITELKQLEELFQPVKDVAQQAAPQDKEAQVETKLQELQTELSLGENANVDRLNKVIDGLVEMVPGALGAVVSMFTSPILGALVGPVTKQVLDHIQQK